jgi:spore coat protein U domain-containing protein, fimbrial subunit CupE1/2/3/6
MKLSSIAAAVLAGTAIFAVTPAFAGNTVGGAIHVGLEVVDECTIDTENIDFGTIGIVQSNIDTSADITIECTKRTPYAISLDEGIVGASTAGREMENGTSDTINYQLYSNAGYSTVWGKVVGTDTVDSASAAGADEVHTIYARVPSHQNVPIGTYADTITATIWYADDATP